MISRPNHASRPRRAKPGGAKPGNSKRFLAIGVVAIAIAVPIAFAGCGGSAATTAVDPNAAEVSPPGDIPDNQAFVPYSPPNSGYQVTVPEGWSRSTQGSAVSFTDKLNSIRLESGSASAAPTAADGNAEIKKLAGSLPGFTPGEVTTVQRNAGPALLITYTADGPPDPVTGKTITDAFERYEFFQGGKVATVTVSGPDGADNVDPWMIVTDSLKWTS